MALQLFLAAATHAIPNARVARSDITDCLDASSVPQVLSGTANFTQAIKPFNLRLPFTPVAVAVPTTTAQVQAAVACGVKLGVTVSPKSGGHSYASHGLGGEDGHLVVDMKYWNTVALDNSTGIATVGPGSRLGNVAQALYAQGSAAISHGTCPGAARLRNTTAPLELNLRLFVNPYSISVIGVYYGSQAEFKAAFVPLLAKLGIREVYAYDPLTQPIDYDNHETFFSSQKSLMTISVNEAAITAFWSYWTTVAKSYIDRVTPISFPFLLLPLTPPQDWYVTIDIHGGPQSAITRVPADETSYAHRNALLKYEFYDRTSETYPLMASTS
ncbi:hypothetical protein B0O99DRAFT_590161 [Bisporella sp. PMI_857]|nr:hypothetical protein B0O99DRAFT_590723 [Bisporella sp. PMI_857]KAH8600496.1 hypothetical protein B0O99DRAFT_590161 [Bisporella sp. PMI_857]